MSATEFLMSAWRGDPAVLIGCLGLLGAYAAAMRFRFSLRAAAWVAGILLIFLGLASPLGMLADHYLFSVHMAQHILFVLGVPALLLIGMPAGPVNRALQWRPAARAERLFGTPPIAWIAGIGAMGFWHIPAVLHAALSNPGIHRAEHLSLLVAGTLYWWPVLSPVTRLRLNPMPQAAGYLFTSCLACTSMGILIAFAPASLYPQYLSPADPHGILPLIRNSWGISAALDQQIGALMMWVPCCLVYITAIMAMFARWYGEDSPVAEEV